MEKDFSRLIDVRLITSVYFLCLATSVHAQVYKCSDTGQVIYSDKPCADNAQEIKVEVYTPKAEDIETQQRITESYQEESKYHDLLALRQHNENLKKQIQQLYQQRDEELKAFEQKIYRYSDTQVATTEHGLFKKMEKISADYQAIIVQLEAKIKENDSKIAEIHF